MKDSEQSTGRVVEDLNRQVERASLFAHTALGESFSRIGESESLLHGLVDVLLAKGCVTEDELTVAVDNVRAELIRRGELSGPGVMVSIDTGEGSDPENVEIDCGARMHICKAVCCRLDFALTVAEVEKAEIKWDLGRPYFIRHGADGRCIHNDHGSCGCNVYSDRPGVCRRYSCAKDSRIWKNFEQMALNTEWIEQHLGTSGSPRVARAYLHEAIPSSPLRQLASESVERKHGEGKRVPTTIVLKETKSCPRP